MQVYILSLGSKPRYFAVVYPMSSSRPVVRTTPFGRPVVPEVYIRLRTDSILIFSRRDSGIDVLSDNEAINDGS